MEAIWGVSLVNFWLAICIGYHVIETYFDLTEWAFFVPNMILANMRYYFEIFIFLTFALNELINATYERFDSQLEEQNS